MTKIKICGITNYEDAQNALDLGAGFLGLNFYSKSPRYVVYKKAHDIISKLNGKAGIVGVFVNENIDKLKEISEHCNLDLIQLSGDEDCQYVDKLRNSIKQKIIKAFRIKNKINDNLINSFNSDYIMLDSFKDGFHGGTGEKFDLSSVSGADNRKLFLAGGLTDANVKEAIKKLNPFAVDVCSSIESKPGKNDYGKMKKFIEADAMIL